MIAGQIYLVQANTVCFRRRNGLLSLTRRQLTNPRLYSVVCPAGLACKGTYFYNESMKYFFGDSFNHGFYYII